MPRKQVVDNWYMCRLHSQLPPDTLRGASPIKITDVDAASPAGISLLDNKKTGTVTYVAHARGVDDNGDDGLSSWR